MKLVYLTVVLVASLFALSEVEAHKKHKHGHGHGHGHDVHHVHHHHYYHSGHGHGYGHRYKREVIDVVKPEESLGLLIDKLIVKTNLDDGKKLVDLAPKPEEKPLIGAIVKDAVKEVKVEEKVQNVASFAL